MPDLTTEERSQIAEAMKDARRRKAANRANLNAGYDALMGTPMSPQDHPANNVSHPHGNYGRPDATIPPLSGGTSQPMSTGVDDY